MLNHNTLEGLRSLRLPAMASGLLSQREQPDYSSLSFEERLGLLVDAELLQRQNRRLERVFKAAKLAAGASVEDVDYASARGLDKATFVSLVSSDWVEHHHNVIVLGPTGVGKTYLACALAHSAIQHGYTALYVRTPRLLSDLSVARGDGRIARVMASLARFDILILDDFLLRPFTSDQTADLLEVVEDRSSKSTIVTSQLPVNLWHEGLGDETVADATLDRLLERSHRFELVGDSRRQRATSSTTRSPKSSK
jgi:DNA replication protein DnaC